MILSDVDIQKAIKKGDIILDPLPEDTQFNSSAVDLRLDTEFKEYDPDLVSQRGVELNLTYSNIEFLKFAQKYLRDIRPETDGSIIIKPRQFILARTLEKLSLKNEAMIAARVEGRSSTARLGLVVHLSAPTIHAGFSGKITLEIINHGPVSLRFYPHKDRICQLIFEQVSSKPRRANLSQFQNQISVTGSSKDELGKGK